MFSDPPVWGIQGQRGTPNSKQAVGNSSQPEPKPKNTTRRVDFQKGFLWGGSDGVDHVAIEVLQHDVANRGSHAGTPNNTKTKDTISLDHMGVDEENPKVIDDDVDVILESCPIIIVIPEYLISGSSPPLYYTLILIAMQIHQHNKNGRHVIHS